MIVAVEIAVGPTQARTASLEVAHFPVTRLELVGPKTETPANRERISATIVQDALPGNKRCLKPAGSNERSLGSAVHCVAAFGLH